MTAPMGTARTGTGTVGRWAGAAILAFPVAVLSHEAGHWLLARLFRFPGARLHFASAGYETLREFWDLVNDGQLAAANAIHPLWQPATVSAGGLVVSYVTIGLACLVMWRRGASPLLGSLAAIAALRFLGGIPLLLARALGVARRPSSDETNVALVSGIPEWLLLTIGFGAVWYVAFTLWRTLPRDERSRSLRGLGLGMVVGGVLYGQVVGPMVLP